MITVTKLRVLLPVGLALLLLVPAGCESGSCKKGKTECTDSNTLRICVSNGSDTFWMPFPCGVGEVCKDQAKETASLVAEDDTDESGEATLTSSNETTADGSDAVCVGKCTQDEVQCVNDQIARACVDGKYWETFRCGNGEKCNADTGTCDGTCTKDAKECVEDSVQLARTCVDGVRWETFRCAHGEKCENGVCERDLDEVHPELKICEKDVKQCATDRVVKICDADQTGWVYKTCLSDMECKDGDCVVKGAVCDPDNTGRCDDDGNSLIRCKRDGTGYEKVDCPDGTVCGWSANLSTNIGYAACVGTRTKGNELPVGSWCGSSQVVDEAYSSYDGYGYVYESTDGVSVTVSHCAANQTCAQITPWVAECVTRPTKCAANEVVCGDVNSTETVDYTKFSLCEVDEGDENAEGRWVVHTCEGANFVCDPQRALLGQMPCDDGCTPGEERCVNTTGDALAYDDVRQVCGQDGKWGDVVEQCYTGEKARRVCAYPVQLDGELTKTVCADPECVSGHDVVEGKGICVNETEFLACDETTGRLQDDEAAVECPTHLCIVTGSRLANGQIPGECLDVADDSEWGCVAGEELCISSGVSTRYLTCKDNGTWNTEPETCDDAMPCQQFQSSAEDGYLGAGLRMIVCGECVPFTQECTGEEDEPQDQIRVCSIEGEWGDAEDCDFGTCVTGMSGDTCTASCMPDEQRCVGAEKVALDGLHNGTAAIQTCDDDGLWSTETETCAGTTTCRENRSGFAIGCVECIGTDIVGGNEQGVVDSRCEENVVQQCNDDNDGFEETEDCGDAEEDAVCQAPGSLVCASNCNYATNDATTDNITCSQALMKQGCGPCTIGSITLPVCTEEAIENINEGETLDVVAAPTDGGTATYCKGTYTVVGADAGTPADYDFGDSSAAYGGVDGCCADKQNAALATAPCGEDVGTVKTTNVDDCCIGKATGVAGSATVAWCKEVPTT